MKTPSGKGAVVAFAIRIATLAAAAAIAAAAFAQAHPPPAERPTMYPASPPSCARCSGAAMPGRIYQSYPAAASRDLDSPLQCLSG